MSQKRKSKQKNVGKLVGRGFLLILLIAAAVVAFLVWDNYFNDRKEGPKKEDASKIEEDKMTETTEATEAELTGANVEKKEVKQYEGEDANSFADLTGAITYAGVSNGVLRVRVNIDQYLENGTCALTLRKEGANTYSAEARIVASASTATCEGFDVSASGLENGNYMIVVYINSGEKTGEIDGEVRI